METRQCNSCGEYKEQYDYTPSTWKYPKHYKIVCNKCRAEQKRKEREEHPAYNKAGYVYIITNKAWSEWCKIGITNTTLDSRLSSYQTNSPFRDYEIYASKKVKDTYKAERVLHLTLEKDGYSKNSEWFKIEPEDAFRYLEEL